MCTTWMHSLFPNRAKAKKIFTLHERMYLSTESQIVTYTWGVDLGSFDCVSLSVCGL